MAGSKVLAGHVGHEETTQQAANFSFWFPWGFISVMSCLTVI